MNVLNDISSVCSRQRNSIGFDCKILRGSVALRKNYREGKTLTVIHNKLLLCLYLITCRILRQTDDIGIAAHGFISAQYHACRLLFQLRQQDAVHLTVCGKGLPL